MLTHSRYIYFFLLNIQLERGVSGTAKYNISRPTSDRGAARRENGSIKCWLQCCGSNGLIWPLRHHPFHDLELAADAGAGCCDFARALTHLLLSIDFGVQRSYPAYRREWLHKLLQRRPLPEPPPPDAGWLAVVCISRGDQDLVRNRLDLLYLQQSPIRVDLCKRKKKHLRLLPATPTNTAMKDAEMGNFCVKSPSNR